jgi:hypothetical protein
VLSEPHDLWSTVHVGPTARSNLSRSLHNGRPRGRLPPQTAGAAAQGPDAVVRSGGWPEFGRAGAPVPRNPIRKMIHNVGAKAKRGGWISPVLGAQWAPTTGRGYSAAELVRRREIVNDLVPPPTNWWLVCLLHTPVIRPEHRIGVKRRQPRDLPAKIDRGGALLLSLGSNG